MREIKFRAWNKLLKEFEYIDDLYWFEENQVHDNNDSTFEIAQYAGVKDKNGTEIYEGDIVTIDKSVYVRNSSNPLGIIIYSLNEFFVIGTPNNDYLWYGDNGRNFCFSYLVVVGNVYENPELSE